VAPRCIRLVIADRHPLLICGLKSVLHADGDFNVVAACQDSTACIKAICGLAPDIALLDIALPPAGGLPVLTATDSEHLKTRVVFFSASLESSAGLAAVARGAYAVIPQDATPQLLVRCLRRVASGQKLLPIPSRDPELKNGHDHRSGNEFGVPSGVLTERERQIIHLVREGLSNKDIGRQFKLSDGTVKVHLHHIYEKLAIHNRTALAVLATKGSPAAGVEEFQTKTEGLHEGHSRYRKADVPE
jgi:two-component system, NarL family, nitrate/nitrite response regulator NarL